MNGLISSLLVQLPAHLPALQVVVPLVAAPLCLLAGRAGLAWIIAFTASIAATAIAATLAYSTYHNGIIHYDMGGWAPPWGIEYVVDTANAFILLLVSAIATVVLAFSPASVAKEIRPGSQHLFYCMFILCLTGLLGIAVTGDAFNVFVFLEISSLSSYALIALGGQRKALTAAFQYLVMGTIGATFFLIGVGLLYMMTGTLNMADLATLMPAVVDTTVIHAALAFLSVGICLKLALFPLHLWLPGAYTYAPSVVTAFLAATATKVAVYVLIRIFFTVFGAVNVFETLGLQNILMVLAITAMFVASIIAIYQDNVKRLFAYSSIAQIGYIILGLSFASETGMAAAIIHLFNHAIIKCAIFLGLGCVALRTGGVSIKDMHGLGQRMPWTMAAIVIGGLGLIGIPMTVGFVSKWYLVQAALEKDMWQIAALIVLSSLLAIIYVWRIVEVAYLKPAPENTAPISEAPLSMLLPLWVMALASIYFGVDATNTLNIALGAAHSLLNGGLL